MSTAKIRNFDSIGNGSLSHLAMEALAIKAGVKRSR